MNYLKLIFLLLICQNSFSQRDSIQVIIRFVDQSSGEPIHNVNSVLYMGMKTTYYTSTSKGEVSFKSPLGIDYLLKSSHARYLADKRVIALPSRKTSDTIIEEIELEYIRTKVEKELIVYAPGSPEIVFESSKLHVEDFELLNSGDILLLTYQKRLKKGSELKLFDGLKVTSSFNVPGNAKELVHDYRGNAHVVCEENVFGIHNNKGKVGISTLDKGYFLSYLAPIVDTNASKLYFSNFNEKYPAFEYFTFDRLDSTYRKILEIEDEVMMEQYLSEYKWVDVRTKLWAKNKELKTGVDAEIWVGASYFTQSIYYKEAYAPMFHRNDSVFVLDYHSDMLFTFNAIGDKIDSVGIYHHYNPRKTGWKREVLQDKVTGEIYAVFDKAGYSYIGKIDVKTGLIPEKVRLEHRYIEKVQIQGNKVYYIYRPFESTQKKYLYREGLPKSEDIGE